MDGRLELRKCYKFRFDFQKMEWTERNAKKMLVLQKRRRPGRGNQQQHIDFRGIKIFVLVRCSCTQVIRRTWASSPLVRVVFLVGVVGDEPSAAQQRPYPMDTQALLNSEHAKYADLVQGNFVDHYHNLTYKNLVRHL